MGGRGWKGRTCGKCGFESGVKRVGLYRSIDRASSRRSNDGRDVRSLRCAYRPIYIVYTPGVSEMRRVY